MKGCITDGILYSHFSDVRDIPWRWKNFTAQELSSNGGGEYYHHEATLDAAQACRDALGLPMVINSAHRDWLHNLAVGGEPRSAHLHIALDISLMGHGMHKLFTSLKRAGFTSFGFYETFIHTDMRLGRRWYGSHRARLQWAPVLNQETPDIML